MASIHGGAPIYSSGGIVLARPVFDKSVWAKEKLDAPLVISTNVEVGDLVDADAARTPWTSVNFV